MSLSPSDLQSLIQAVLNRSGKRINQHEIKYCCTEHDDKTPSATFNPEKQLWNCFGCDAHGDAFDLAKKLGLNPKLKKTAVNPKSQLPKYIPRRWPVNKPEYDYSVHHTYLDPKNSDKIIGYVVRYDNADKTKKQIIPYFKIKDGKYRAGALSKNVPLYGAHRLSTRNTETVFFIEGEKCAVAILKLGGLAVTTQGGTKAVHKSDFTPLKNRKILIWPDNDSVGNKYAESVYKILSPNNDCKIIDISKLKLPKTGDVIDYLKLNPNTTIQDLLNLKTKILSIENWQAELMVDSHDKIKNTLFNIIRILENHESWFNIFGHNKREARPVFISKPPIKTNSNKYPQIIHEEHIISIVEWFGAELDLDVKTNYVYDAILKISKSNEYDPVIEYFDSLKYDGLELIDKWLINFAGAMDTRYTRTVSRKFLISAVARAYKPGCKVDTMLILQGDQGLGKSMLFRTLASDEWFTDHIDKLGSKDARLQLQGPLIIELAELDAIARRDVSTINSFLTAQFDMFRLPYGRITEKFPRSCVFVGTTNPDQFLKDDTGGRRFWPVSVKRIDLKQLKVFRDQLWAEAVHAYKQGECWWLDDLEVENDAKIEQALYRQRDPWEIEVYNYLKTSREIINKGWITTEDLLEYAVRVPIEKRTKYDAIRVGTILKLCGWERSRSRVEGQRVYKYFAPDGFYSDDSGPEKEQGNFETQESFSYGDRDSAL